MPSRGRGLCKPCPTIPLLCGHGAFLPSTVAAQAPCASIASTKPSNFRERGALADILARVRSTPCERPSGWGSCTAPDRCSAPGALSGPSPHPSSLENPVNRAYNPSEARVRHAGAEPARVELRAERNSRSGTQLSLVKQKTSFLKASGPSRKRRTHLAGVFLFAKIFQLCACDLHGTHKAERTNTNYSRMEKMHTRLKKQGRREDTAPCSKAKENTERQKAG